MAQQIADCFQRKCTNFFSILSSLTSLSLPNALLIIIIFLLIIPWSCHLFAFHKVLNNVLFVLSLMFLYSPLCYFLGFMILMYIFESYLDLRQHTALKLPKLPKTLEGVISQEKFEKSRAYSIDKRFSHHITLCKVITARLSNLLLIIDNFH